MIRRWLPFVAGAGILVWVTALVMLALVYSHTNALNGWTQPELLSLIGVQVLLGGFIHTFIQPNMQQLMQDVQ